jgi:hypothetical protein
MRTRIVQFLVFVIAASVFNVQGLAQEKRSPEDLARMEEEAWKAADSGEFQKAIDIWEDMVTAISGEGLAGIHKNLAVAYGMLKKRPEAWFHLTSYLEKAGKEDNKAGKRLEKLEKKLMETHRKVAITCAPDGATLYFGLEPAGPAYACPITWWFEPGKQFVYLEKNGFRAQTAQYDVRKRGERGSWTVKLVALPKFGHLVIKGEGKAIQVFLDGSLEGTVPFKRKLEEGTYELMVGGPGKMPWKKTVVIKADTTTVEEPPNAQKTVTSDRLPVTSGQVPVTSGQVPVTSGQVPVTSGQVPVTSGQVPVTSGQVPVAGDQVMGGKRSKAGPVALLAGGLGVVVVGAILNGVGYSKEGDLYEKYNPGEPGGKTAIEHNPVVEGAQGDYEAAYADEVKPLKTLSTVTYIVGSTAATAGVVWLIVEAIRTPDKKKTLNISPMMGPGAAGAVFGLEF